MRFNLLGDRRQGLTRLAAPLVGDVAPRGLVRLAWDRSTSPSRMPLGAASFTVGQTRGAAHRATRTVVDTQEPDYALRRPIEVSVFGRGRDFEAAYETACVRASGASEEEAISNLCSLMVDLLETLAAEPPGRLGPAPLAQLQALQHILTPRS